MSDSEEQSEIARAFRSLPSRFHAGRLDKRIIYQVSVDDDLWTVSISPDACEVISGKTAESAHCVLKISKELLVKTFRGEYTPSMMDLVTGKIKTNDPQLLLLFKRVFE